MATELREGWASCEGGRMKALGRPYCSWGTYLSRVDNGGEGLDKVAGGGIE